MASMRGVIVLIIVVSVLTIISRVMKYLFAEIVLSWQYICSLFEK